MTTTSPTSSGNLIVGPAPAGTLSDDLSAYSTLTRAVALAEGIEAEHPLAEIARVVADDLQREAMATWGVVRALDHVREGCYLARYGCGVVPR